jgi:hypothetical protein
VEPWQFLNCNPSSFVHEKNHSKEVKRSIEVTVTQLVIEPRAKILNSQLWAPFMIPHQGSQAEIGSSGHYPLCSQILQASRCVWEHVGEGGGSWTDLELEAVALGPEPESPGHFPK